MASTGGAGPYTTTITAVPEPSTLLIGLMAGMGLFPFAWWNRRRRSAAVGNVLGLI
jgi:hypothetical protein